MDDSCRLPLYWASRRPKDAVVLTGYNGTFAEKNLSYPCRELATELGYIGNRSTALDEWYFKNGARLVARGVGSAPTGINPITLLIMDDPIKDREQANSEVERENIWSWYTGNIVQRFWPDTRAILIQTRWHEDDLYGRLKLSPSASEWTFINVPAIAENDDPLGREIGEALWPEGKPIEFLESLRLSDPYEFEALFQGNPTPKEGSTFKVDNLQIVDVIPPLTKVARAWDIAHSAGKGDYTVGGKIGRCEDGRYIILDVRRERLDTDERDVMIKETAITDGKAVRIRFPIDPGGKSWAKHAIRMVAGYPVHAELVTKAKETRWDAFSSQVNAGNVLMLRGPWNSQVKEELRVAPNGKHDDVPDALSDSFDDVSDGITFKSIQNSIHTTQPTYAPAIQSSMPTARPQQPTPVQNGQFKFRR